MVTAHVSCHVCAGHGVGAVSDQGRRAWRIVEGQELPVRRYLGGFGPASAKDVSSSCGWSVTAARRVLRRLDLRRFRDESGGELRCRPPTLRRPCGSWGSGMRFSSSHPRRAQILPEEHGRVVFATTSSRAVPTFSRRRAGGGHLAPCRWRRSLRAVPRAAPFRRARASGGGRAPHAVLRVGLRVGRVRERGCPNGSRTFPVAPRAPAHGLGRQARGRCAERTDGRSRS